MSFRNLLIHRCDLVQRNVVTGTDEYGRDIYGESVIPGIACRADKLRSRASRDQQGVDFIVENVLYLAADVPITEDMTISNVVDLKGNPVLTGSFSSNEIFTVYGRVSLHHYEVTLQKVGD